MNLKIALMSDIHFGTRNDSEFFLDSFLNFADKIFFPYLQNNDISTLLLLGDIWDRRKYINFHTLHRAKNEFFDILRNMNITIKIIYGNHDTFFKNRNDVNSIDLLLNSYSNIEIVEFAKVFEFDGLNLGMIGWIHNGNLKESLEWIADCKADVLCGHFEIKNFEMTRGCYCEDGFEHDIFKRFEFVFSGHFHVISNNNNIFYLGNSYQFTWSDFGLQKGFHIFDTNTRQLTLVDNPYSVYEKYQYDDDCDILTFDYEKYRNKIVRVYIDSLILKSRRKFDLFMDKLTQISYDVSVQEIEQMNDELFSSDKISIEYTDTIEYIKQYIESIEINNIDKDILKGHFSNIYNEAIEKSITL